jgi:hypothetical protein
LLGFASPAASSGSGIGRRGSSGYFQRWGDGRREASGYGEDDGVLRVLDWVLVRWQGSAGDVASVGVLRLLGDDVVLQRIGRGEVFRGMRQGKIERIEEIRRTGAHRRRRNCPGKPADLRISGDKLRRPGGFSGRRTKGRWRRTARGLYRQGSGKKRAGIDRY